MSDLRLFAIELGCTPKGRNKEQHDIFFAVSDSIQDVYLHQRIRQFWADAGKIHIDAYVEITHADGYDISVVLKSDTTVVGESGKNLWFLNLGGYTKDYFGEHHQTLFLVEEKIKDAIGRAMQSPFVGRMDELSEKAVPHPDNNKRLADVDGEINIGDYLDDYKIIFKRNQDGIDSILQPAITGYLKIDV